MKSYDITRTNIGNKLSRLEVGLSDVVYRYNVLPSPAAEAFTAVQKKADGVSDETPSIVTELAKALQLIGTLGDLRNAS